MGSRVLSTANLVMAATLTPGVMHIKCDMHKPKVTNLCTMLIWMGVNVAVNTGRIIAGPLPPKVNKSVVHTQCVGC